MYRTVDYLALKPRVGIVDYLALKPRVGILDYLALKPLVGDRYKHVVPFKRTALSASCTIYLQTWRTSFPIFLDLPGSKLSTSFLRALRRNVFSSIDGPLIRLVL